jgi:hypothetical protein
MIGQRKSSFEDPDPATDICRHMIIGGIKRLLEHDVPPGRIVGMLANEIADMLSEMPVTQRNTYITEMAAKIRQQALFYEQQRLNPPLTN